MRRLLMMVCATSALFVATQANAYVCGPGLKYPPKGYHIEPCPEHERKPHVSRAERRQQRLAEFKREQAKGWKF
jgi:hypothetical protein